MIELLLCTILQAPAAPPVPQDPPVPQEEEVPPGPTPEEIAEAVAALEGAFKGKVSSEDRVAIIENYSHVVCPEVIAWMDKGLKDKDRDVRVASIEALRWMDHPDAVADLNSLYEKDKKLRKDYDLLARLLKAIGQHGDPSSVEILTDSPFSARDGKVVKARILGLGMIRDKAALEGLMDLMKKVSYRDITPYADDFRLSLVMLTGVDQGRDKRLWEQWWANNRRDVEISKEPGLESKVDRFKWADYWDLSPEDLQPKGKGRGKDKGDGRRRDGPGRDRRGRD